MDKKKIITYIIIIIAVLVIGLTFFIKKVEHKETKIEVATTEIKDSKEILEKSLENNNTVTENETNNQTEEVIQIKEKKEDNTNKVQYNTQKIETKTKNKNEQNQTKEENLNKQKTEQETKSTYNQDAFNNTFLKNHPSYGEQYAKLIIGKIGINAPIFFGADDEIILKGVGHDSGSYFPGEGGSIIMCEHNYLNNFKRFRRIEKWQYNKY